MGRDRLATAFFLLHRRRVFNAGENSGWDGSASAASCTSSTGCCAAPTDTTFVADRQAARRRAGRCALRHHARRRHAAAARCRAPAGRQDGASAEPAALRAASSRVVGGYGILQPRVTPSLPIGREGSLYQRRVLRARRHRSVRRRGLRRLSGPVRRGLVHRQGHLRRRCLRGRACRARARQRAPQPRPLRRHLRARGPGLRHRGRRGVSVALRRRRQRQHRWTRGDWQLLPWIFGIGRRRAHAIPAVGRWKMLDNLRRSLLAPATLAGAVVVGWLLPLPAAVDRARCSSSPPSPSPPFCRSSFAILPRRAGHSLAQPSAARLPDDLRLAVVQTVVLRWLSCPTRRGAWATRSSGRWRGCS